MLNALSHCSKATVIFGNAFSDDCGMSMRDFLGGGSKAYLTYSIIIFQNIRLETSLKEFQMTCTEKVIKEAKEGGYIHMLFLND